MACKRNLGSLVLEGHAPFFGIKVVAVAQQTPPLDVEHPCKGFMLLGFRVAGLGVWGLDMYTVLVVVRTMF